ncbi:hypothetical protein AMK59_376 [Oryctes borbonicus]|uniref:Tc1-like transposase DDE domain-containing protein n=1 Tax=Oryctes borbonicus TaxID=1629725 RepID=A0A0T6BCT2_9SCAR|nr:hypothetical protein AMK59_376 [Oryctes borbonicus]
MHTSQHPRKQRVSRQNGGFPANIVQRKRIRFHRPEKLWRRFFGIRKAYLKKGRAHLVKKKILCHHNNSSAVVIEKLTQLRYEFMPYPPYFPNLDPCDIFRSLN